MWSFLRRMLARKVFLFANIVFWLGLAGLLLTDPLFAVARLVGVFNGNVRIPGWGGKGIFNLDWPSAWMIFFLLLFPIGLSWAVKALWLSWERSRQQAAQRDGLIFSIRPLFRGSLLFMLFAMVSMSLFFSGFVLIRSVQASVTTEIVLAILLFPLISLSIMGLCLVFLIYQTGMVTIHHDGVAISRLGKRQFLRYDEIVEIKPYKGFPPVMLIQGQTDTICIPRTLDKLAYFHSLILERTSSRELDASQEDSVHAPAALQGQVNHLIIQANQLVAAGQIDQAMDTYRDALALVPDNPTYQSYHLIIGDLLFQNLRYDEAAEAYRATIQAIPKHAQAWCSLGCCLLEMGQEQDAVQAVEHSLKLNSKDDDNQFAAACLYARLKDSQRARQHLKKLKPFSAFWRERILKEPLLKGLLSESQLQKPPEVRLLPAAKINSRRSTAPFRWRLRSMGRTASNFLAPLPSLWGIEFVEPPSGARLRLNMPAQRGDVNPIVFLPGGDKFILGNAGCVGLFDARTLKQIWGVRVSRNWIDGVAVSNDGKWLAVATSQKAIVILRTFDGFMQRQLTGHTQWVSDVAFNPEQTQVVSGAKDGTVRFWDWHMGKEIDTIVVAPNWTNIWSVAYQPHGNLLAASTEDRRILLWNRQTHQDVRTLLGHKKQVWQCAFSPDGQKLASVSEDRRAILWDVSSGEKLHILKGHRAEVQALAFSPDGSLLATGGWDCSILCWDTQTGKCLKEVRGHTAGVCSLAFSPDGGELISGSRDRTAIVWNDI